MCIYVYVHAYPYIYMCVYETEYMQSVALFLCGCLLVNVGGS